MFRKASSAIVRIARSGGWTGPSPRAKGSCTYRLADRRFRACRIDDQNISNVTCFRLVFPHPARTWKPITWCRCTELLAGGSVVLYSLWEGVLLSSSFLGGVSGV